MAITIDGQSLTVEDVINVAKNGGKVKLSSKSVKQVKACRAFLQQTLDRGQTIYGVNTGFGHLARVKVDRDDLDQLQLNLVRSHAVGVGDPYSREEVRAMMLLRLNTLARGYSGVRPALLRGFVDFLNKGVTPFVPESGSLGASGDLAPAAHVALVLLGEGNAFVNGKVASGSTALRKARIQPIHLQYKEGLAVINGTQLMTAFGCFLVHGGRNFLKSLDIAGALSLEVLLGSTIPFEAKVQSLRPHPKQIITADNIRKLVSSSKLVNSGGKVQDAYSIRCIPQIHGAYKQGFDFLRNIVDIEINSVTDNPVVFQEAKEVVSCGNFHGQFLSTAFDLFGLCMSNAATVSERRIERLLNPALSQLSPFLTDRAGVRTGLMITQYTAASLTSETRSLAHPASVDNIPVSAEQEDHSSMGVNAGNKAKRILRKAAGVVAIELICASEGVEFRGAEKLGIGSRKTFEFVRGDIPRLSEDRSLTTDITRLTDAILDGRLVNDVEKDTGQLGC